MAIELSGEYEQRVLALAAESGLEPEQLIRDALNWYLQDQAEVSAQLAAARLDVAEGRALTSDRVLERLQRHTRAA